LPDNAVHALQAAILLSLIHSVETGEIATPLAPPSQQVRPVACARAAVAAAAVALCVCNARVQAPGQPNSMFLREHIARLLTTSFDQLTP
jgi:hypothetical protein